MSESRRSDGGETPGGGPAGDRRGVRRADRRLRRELSTGGAVLLGLGSILGTGVFVSIGVAAGAAGPAVVLAVALAALIAAANGLASAQLAASHPVSGGTYEYGYRYLSPALGFTAGWMFLAAKSASAATAALGFAGYLLAAVAALGGPGAPAGPSRGWQVAVAVATVATFTGVVLSGLRRSNRVNAAIVVAALGSLLFFVAAGAPTAVAGAGTHFTPFVQPDPGRETRGPLAAVLYATALMFVAYTGYGRIATLGEEVRSPRRTIPRAIVVTLVVSLALYLAVAAVGVGSVGAAAFARAAREEAAPLGAAARSFGVPGASGVLAAGALVALLGVLLNLILGLSRVLLAMGRRRDVPALFAGLDEAATTPAAAVVAVGVLIAALALVGDVETTWSFSAFTVLVYYALTNLAALRMPAADRLYPVWTAWFGLAGCLFLAFWVDLRVWAAGLALIAAGLLWHAAARRLRAKG